MGVHGPKAYAYGKVVKDERDRTAIPSGYTILGPDTIKTLMGKYGVATDAALLAAMGIDDGITATP